MAVLDPIRALRHPDDPPAPPLDPGATLVDLFFEYGAAVREVAAGLVALGAGPGDRVGILAANQPRWHMADIGIMAAGAVSVPAYPTGAASQVAHVLGQSGSRFCFAGDRDQLAKLLLARGRLPALERIVMLTAPPDGLDDDFVLTFDDVRSVGRERLARAPGTVSERARALTPDAVATLVYTSGTTGPPKGTMITHRNASETVRAVTRVVRVGPTDRFLSFLPLSHIAERCTSHLGQIVSGGETWFARSLATLADDLRACRPTVFFAVPRVWEKFQQVVLEEVAAMPRLVRARVDRLVGLGLEAVAVGEGQRGPLRWRERLAYQALSATLGAWIRHQMGLDRGRIFVSAAAPVDPELLRWFHAVGIPVAEVYGQTEGCGPTTMNRPGRTRIGTVGEPLPGVEVRTADDGEVLVRGPNVCAGYWQDPAGTAALLEGDWMHSGDIGVLDDGYLRITGRKKDLIVTSSGKNIAPQEIETHLRSAPFIDQAVVVGEGRNYLTALVALDGEAVEAALAGHHGSVSTEDLATHPLVEAAVAGAMERLNAGRAPAERIRAWRILPRELTVAGGELTPTLKVRRSVVVERFADLVDEMYAR
jgi:long-chain acyl-CoA synthetase